MKHPRPSIYIYTYLEDNIILKEIIAGIEEEGVLFDRESVNNNISSEDLASQAAKKSILGIGIGIKKQEIKVSINEQVKYGLVDFKTDKPRVIGQNVARYIKQRPFLFY
ncbi:MAG: glycerol dehydratase reactivase beta/small subunit family protein [Eubacteriales bacterium]